MHEKARRATIVHMNYMIYKLPSQYHQPNVCVFFRFSSSVSEIFFSSSFDCVADFFFRLFHLFKAVLRLWRYCQPIIFLQIEQQQQIEMQ